MNHSRDIIVFTSVVCATLLLAAATVRALGLEAQADAAIRFLLFTHRNATLAASFALYAGVILLINAGSIAALVRRASRNLPTVIC